MCVCVGGERERMKNLTVIPQSASERPHQRGEKTALMRGKYRVDIADWDVLKCDWEAYMVEQEVVEYASEVSNYFSSAARISTSVPEGCRFWQMSYPLLAYMTCNKREFFSSVI